VEAGIESKAQSPRTEHSWQLVVGSWHDSVDCTQAKREGDPGVAFVLSAMAAMV